MLLRYGKKNRNLWIGVTHAYSRRGVRLGPYLTISENQKIGAKKEDWIVATGFITGVLICLIHRDASIYSWFGRKEVQDD